MRQTLEQSILLKVISCMLISIAMTTVSVALTGEHSAMDAESIEQRLAFLNERILHQFEMVRISSETVDFEALDREAKRLSSNLDEVERRASQLQPEEGQRLLRKVASLRDLVYNLELATSERRTSPLIQGIEPGQTTEIEQVAEQIVGVPNDACESAIPVNFGSYSGDTSDASNDGAACGSSMLTQDVWFRYDALTTQRVFFNTVGSSYDTVLSLHQSCPGTLENQLVCNDDYNGLQSAVSAEFYGGNSYLIRLSGVNGAAGAYVLNVELGGTISGTVTHAVTGQPITNCGVYIWDVSGRLVGSTYSDLADGTYTSQGLHTGVYYVGTRNYTSPLIDEMYDDIVCPTKGCDPMIGDPVQLSIGSAVNQIDFSLIPGGSITGTVTDALTGEFPWTRLKVYNDSGEYIDDAYTGSTGQYRLSGLSTGDYYVKATHSAYIDMLYDGQFCSCGYECPFESGTLVHVEIYTETSGIDFSMQSLGSISGSVTSASTGDPFYWADVSLYDESGRFLENGTSGADGSYLFGSLEDGTYYLVAGDYGFASQVYDGVDCNPYSCNPLVGTAVVISGLSSVENVDFALTPLGRISGVVTNGATGLPEPGVPVLIYRESSYSFVDSMITGSDGVYLSDPLRSETYFVKTNDDDFNNELFDDIPCPTGCTGVCGTPVQVNNNVVTSGIDFELVPQGVIEGSVTSAQTGDPLDGIKVEILDSDGKSVGYTYSSAGLFRLSGVEAGTYFIATNSGEAWLDQLYDGIECWGGPGTGCNVLGGTPVVVVDATVTPGIDFSLSSSGAVSGSVTDMIDGSPVTSGNVALVKPDGSIFGTASITSGTYTVIGVIPGEYYAVADAYSTYIDGIYNGLSCSGAFPNGCDPTVGEQISVGVSSNISGIDFSLRRLSSITGTVRDGKSGVPLYNVPVRLYDSSGDVAGYDRSDDAGYFELSGLWPDSYYAGTDLDSTTYIDQLYSNVPCYGGVGSSQCYALNGTPINLGADETFTIVFDLQRTGGFSGRIINEESGQPISDYRVKIYNSEGSYIGFVTTGSDGVYASRGLTEGSYYAVTVDPPFSSISLYYNELYDNIPCWETPPYGCNPTKGDAVEVSSGQITRFVDFSLKPVPPNVQPRTGISGTVTEGPGSGPIPGVIVDVWDATNLNHLDSVVTDLLGDYTVDIAEGTYFVSTDNAMGWTNVIWDGYRCPQGSAFDGGCEPEMGNPVTVVADQLTTGIDFTMNGDIFEDGFESGNVSAWSSSVGN